MANGNREAHQYLYKPDQLTKLQKCSEIENFVNRGRSLLVVVATPPSENYENFTERVREYNTKAPFNFLLPRLFDNYTKVFQYCILFLLRLFSRLLQFTMEYFQFN